MMEENLSPSQLLQFYVDSGVDEAIFDEAFDRFSVKENQAIVSLDTLPSAGTAYAGVHESLSEASAVAAAAGSLDELKAALDGFKPLTLKRTASQMVFADGNPAARIMMVGDVPSADDERAGRPFSGEVGLLFDRMMAAIGLSRDNIYITNVISWRPPGGRTPEEGEVALSLPFVRRHIELVNPAVLVFVGGSSAKLLLETKQPVSKLRGKWQEYQTSATDTVIPAMTILHPLYLRNTPVEKAQAWSDLLKLKSRLAEMKLPPQT